MVDFDLDLRAVEDHLDLDEAPGPAGGDHDIVLARLDGSTPPERWIEAVEDGNVLVLAVEGDLNELAAGFARDIRDAGGHLVTFRNFLIVSPPDIGVDSSRLE